MANSITALNKEIWSAEIQEELEKSLVALEICKLHPELKNTDTFNKPYINKFRAKTYTPGSDFTALDVTATNDYLTIGTYKVIPIYVDKVEEVQSSYPLRSIYSERIVQDLRRGIDATILSDYDQATSYVDDADLGGTAGNSASVNPSNVHRLFTAAAKKLDNQLVGQVNRFAVVSPTIIELIRLYTGGKDSNFGDEVMQNGYVGSRFGFKIYQSANLTYVARWTPANQPSDGDTVTINGVVFTFETGVLTDLAGKVKSATSAAVTLDNLVTALNAPDTSVTDVFYAISSADSLAALEGIVATDGTTYLGLEHVGGGEIALAASETNDPWSVETIHCLFGQKGAIDFALQVAPEIGFNQEPKRLPGSGNLVAWDIFGWKTFIDGKKKLVDVRVAASTFA